MLAELAAVATETQEREAVFVLGRKWADEGERGIRGAKIATCVNQRE